MFPIQSPRLYLLQRCMVNTTGKRMFDDFIHAIEQVNRTLKCDKRHKMRENVSRYFASIAICKPLKPRTSNRFIRGLCRARKNCLYASAFRHNPLIVNIDKGTARPSIRLKEGKDFAKLAQHSLYTLTSEAKITGKLRAFWRCGILSRLQFTTQLDQLIHLCITLEVRGQRRFSIVRSTR